MLSNKNIYNLDIKKLAIILTPVILRKRRFIAWLAALVTPIDYVYKLFVRFRGDMLYRLQITGQVCYVEKMLNDRYDTIQRRIYIRQAKEYPPLFLYQKIEGKPVILYTKAEQRDKTFLYTKAESGKDTVDFIVYVPAIINFNEKELLALVNTYKLAGKTYKVSYV
ncbi:hypothetical protein [Pinibacter soli]|uniref:Uncharacterized protein n=1 Tax=Pinibacter soli TaxID=3044211 RepID=A0ABT6R983_9BACT|nr:hypothetical protein [Pinibacter soli]MDI3319118.1 hypothetical protein [Pinibacter soli]